MARFIYFAIYLNFKVMKEGVGRGWKGLGGREFLFLQAVAGKNFLVSVLRRQYLQNLLSFSAGYSGFSRQYLNNWCYSVATIVTTLRRQLSARW
jgi:hypothetical protein